MQSQGDYPAEWIWRGFPSLRGESGIAFVLLLWLRPWAGCVGCAAHFAAPNLYDLGARAEGARMGGASPAFTLPRAGAPLVADHGKGARPEASFTGQLRNVRRRAPCFPHPTSPRSMPWPPPSSSAATPFPLLPAPSPCPSFYIPPLLRLGRRSALWIAAWILPWILPWIFRSGFGHAFVRPRAHRIFTAVFTPNPGRFPGDTGNAQAPTAPAGFTFESGAESGQYPGRNPASIRASIHAGIHASFHAVALPSFLFSPLPPFSVLPTMGASAPRVHCAASHPPCRR